MTEMTIIGIIGGVGPEAGLDFVKKIFSNTKAKKDQDHLNCMLVSCSSIIPDRTAFLLQGSENTENPAFGMLESARRLYMAGVRIAAVACNTAHAGRIFSLFSAMVKKELPEMKIINMLETCAGYVKEKLPCKCIGLLATIGTHKSGVYKEYFREEDGFTLIEPDPEGQNRVFQAIYSDEFGIKANSGKISSKAKNYIDEEILTLLKRGAEAVILGCTELPLAIKSDKYHAPIIDPALVTARRLIELTAPEKLLPLNCF